MSLSNKVFTGILLASIIIIALVLLIRGKTDRYLDFATPTPQVIIKPTEECSPGASFIPDQGCTVSLTEPLASQETTPIIVWTEEGLDWKVSAGSPEFALYTNGLLIFRNPRANPENLNQYLSLSLNPAEQDQLLKTLAIPEMFFELDDSYNNIRITDQPWHTIMVWHQRRFKRVRVYGDLRNDNSRSRPTEPQAFLQLFDKLASYRPPREANPWTPERVELWLWPTTIVSPAGLPVWPETWPGLNHPETIKRSEESYSIFLDWDQFEQLNQLTEPPSARMAIDGKAWSLNYRYLFPNEELWR